MNGPEPKICLIAAIAENGVIGKPGGLPWHIGSELKHFRKITLGKPVIFGRKTFESFGGKPLPGRPNIVVSRDASFAAAGAAIAPSLENAIETASRTAREIQANEIFICGGAEIYRQALPLAHRFYLTHIHLRPEGDTLFPAFDQGEWVETKREFHPAAAGEDADYTLTVLERQLP